MLLQMVGSPFLRRIILHNMHMPQFPYPSIHWQTLRLFPYLSYWEQWCNGHGSTDTSSRYRLHFLGDIFRRVIARQYGGPITNIYWSNILCHAWCQAWCMCHFRQSSQPSEAGVILIVISVSYEINTEDSITCQGHTEGKWQSQSSTLGRLVPQAPGSTVSAQSTPPQGCFMQLWAHSQEQSSQSEAVKS